MNADELKKRTKQFALRILKLVAALPNTVTGRAIGGQLVRAGRKLSGSLSRALKGGIRSEDGDL